MKTNKILKFSVAFLGSVTLLTGCIKETYPESGYATGDQVADSYIMQKGAIASMSTILITNYLNIAEEHFAFGYPGIMGATDRLAGEVFPVSGNLDGGNQYYDRWQPYLYNFALGPNGWAAPFFYLNYYQFIYTTNDVISIASNDPALGEMMGLGKTFRAMSYLDLARLYDALDAKAPLKASYEADLAAVKGLTVPISVPGMALADYENNPRLPREEMFAFILSDLNDAETLLANYTRPTANLPSLAVVYGLKARAYLWLGGFTETYENVPTGNAAYALAAEYARKAITASGCSIMTEAQWTDPKTGFNTVNASWMWAMIQSTDTIIANIVSWSAHMSPEAVWGYGYGSQPGISVFSYNRLSDTDFRKKVFVGPDRSYEAMAPYTSLTETEFAKIAPYTSFKFHTNSGEKKNYTVGNVTDIPLMRVEEMYLIEAEATAHYDEAAGKALLLSFMANRDASYAFPATSDVVDEIIFQKRIEFWGEGIVFYDLKRLNMGLHGGDEDSNSPPGGRYTTDGRAPWWNCCIPLSAVQQNRGLDGKNNPDPSQTVAES